MANEFWSFDSLRDFAQETKDVQICGKFVQIKKLPASIMEATEGDSINTTFSIAVEGLANPKLTAAQLRNLPIDFVKTLSDEIIAFSGINMEKAEKN